MSEREEVWQVSPLGRRWAGHHGTEYDELSEMQLFCSDDYRLERKWEYHCTMKRNCVSTA